MTFSNWEREGEHVLKKGEGKIEDEFPEKGRENRILLQEKKRKEGMRSDLKVLTVPSRNENPGK